MRLAGISVVGWIHTVGCIAALVLGAVNLVAAKGTPQHKLRSSAYAVSMIVAMGLSLAIYRFDIPVARGRFAGPGVFDLISPASGRGYLFHSARSLRGVAPTPRLLGVHAPDRHDRELLSSDRRSDQ